MNYKAESGRYESMIYRRCGESGLRIPIMSFGLWHNFGDNDPYSNCRDMITGALDMGITHFDLANNYGPPAGASEEIFGRILHNELDGYRDEIIISTKAGYDMWEGPYGYGGSKKYLISSLDQSLKRMKIDYVDVFYHHCPDADTPLEETVEALEQIIHQGKALYVGISNYSPKQTKEIYNMLLNKGIHCLAHQLRFSMLDQSNKEILHAAKELEMGTIAFCPLAQGLLTDKYLNGIPENSRAAGSSRFLNRNNITEHKVAKLIKLNEMAKSREQTLAQMALAWVMSQTTSVILGASRPEQITENVRSLSNIHFKAEELKIIDGILSTNE